MRWLPHVVTTAPAEEPVSLAEARAQINVAAGDATYDAELGIYIQAARDRAERVTGTKLITQTVLLQADCFAALQRLPIGPLQTITSIKYLDSTGAEKTLDPAVYEAVLVGLRPLIRLKPNQAFPGTFSSLDAVRVTATAGYGDATALAEAAPAIKQAILLLVGTWFRDREDTSEAAHSDSLPNGVRTLLSHHKMPA